MLMPGRKYEAANGYRYGFNGKENDNEVKGEGNQQDYGMRIYDPRLGRFLSVDPLVKAFPMLTTYQFSSNSPVSNIDLDGKEAENFIFGLKRKIFGVTSLKMNNLNSLIGEVQKQNYTINITDPTKDMNALYKQIANNVNSIYGTDQGSFRFGVQQKKGEITKGDYLVINPGWKGLDIAVKVADVTRFNNDKIGQDGPHEGFSITFRTLEGHVEVGSITFTALFLTNPQTGAKSFEFNISSTSQIDVGIATVLLNKYSRNAQQRVWQQVLSNVADFLGGNVESANQRIDKYKPEQIDVVNNDEKTLGSPKPEATPTTEFKEIKIEKKKK
jgi:RHS repeat-associated protein